jgi:hypothetical protein
MNQRYLLYQPNHHYQTFLMCLLFHYFQKFPMYHHYPKNHYHHQLQLYQMYQPNQLNQKFLKCLMCHYFLKYRLLRLHH